MVINHLLNGMILQIWKPLESLSLVLAIKPLFSEGGYFFWGGGVGWLKIAI